MRTVLWKRGKMFVADIFLQDYVAVHTGGQ
jgi:hypothetical protein